MTVLKLSGIFAAVSVLSYLWAVMRGDFMCASNFTACLIFAFCVFGLVAMVLLIIGVFRRA
jgi:hypothetical protein